MNFETKKLNKRQEAILRCFFRGGEFSVADVLGYLQKDFAKISRITVVRDMAFLVREGFLMRQGAGRAVKYTAAPLYNLVRPIDVEKYFSTEQDRRQIKGRFDFGIFDAFRGSVFTVQEKKNLASLYGEFRRKFKKIESPGLIAKEFERIMIEFSWKSSQIEGNTYSLLDTEALIKENKIAAGKTKQETQMILNHKKAFDFILEHKNEFKALSRAKIEQLHRILTAGLGIGKNLRTAPVGITGTNYKPLDNVFQIEEAIGKMLKLINAKKDFFEKAFLSLILLSYIQPFEDGNKRVARLVSNAVLLAYGTAPISYRAVDEVEYKKASLLFYEVNNLSYFKQVFMNQFEFAVRNYF